MPKPRLVSRSRDSFAYHCEIAKPFGTLDHVIRWCKNETVGDWGWQLVDTSSDDQPGRYFFYFDSDRDYCAFSLTWC